MGLFGSKKRLGTGLTLRFVDSNVLMDISDGVEESDMSRAAVDVTGIAAAEPGAGEVGNREYLFGKLVGAGRWTFEIFHNPDQPIDGLIHKEAEQIVMSLPKAEGEVEAPTVSARGAVVELSATYRKEEAIMRRVTVQLTGAKSQTAAPKVA